MITEETKVVCLGGGIGTVNLVRGLKEYTQKITVVVSTADDGGSAGRLRRLYNIAPPGDAISCLSAMLPKDREKDAAFLTYRFPGERYGKDEELGGQKLGSLMLVAARDLTGSFEEALVYMKKTFNACGTILPATTENLMLKAVTTDGITVDSEENIDLGRYEGERVLEHVSISPKKPHVPQSTVKALSEADCIIAGPGDLYTTVLPILLIPDIADFLKKSKKPKLYILNVANKPFETRGYNSTDFVKAIENHLGTFPFSHVLLNSNMKESIPENYAYTYVKNDFSKNSPFAVIESDVVQSSFPLYHDSSKLASKVADAI